MPGHHLVKFDLRGQSFDFDFLLSVCNTGSESSDDPDKYDGSQHIILPVKFIPRAMLVLPSTSNVSGYWRRSNRR
jgi:hypothetical protein